MSVAQKLIDLKSEFFKKIINETREEIEEYLEENKQKFFMAYFPKYYHNNPASIPTDLMAEGILGYLKDEIRKEKEREEDEKIEIIEENGEEVENQDEEEEDEEGSFLISLIFWWTNKHMYIYEKVENELKKINPNLEEIGKLTLRQSQQITQQSIELYGSLKFYIFAVLNSLSLDDSVMKELEINAFNDLQKYLQQQNELKKSYDEISFYSSNSLRKSNEKSLPSFPSSNTSNIDKKLSLQQILTDNNDPISSKKLKIVDDKLDDELYMKKPNEKNSRGTIESLEVPLFWRNKSEKTYDKRTSFVIPRNEGDYSRVKFFFFVCFIILNLMKKNSI